MSINVKKICSILLMAVTVISVIPSPAYAAEIEEAVSEEALTVMVDSDTEITVVISDSIKDNISDDVIEGIITDPTLKDGDVITIYEIVDINSQDNNPISVAETESYTYPTTTTDVGGEYKAQNYFIISAAKGQTVTLTSEFKRTLTVNITAGTPYVKANVGASLTAKYGTTQKFVGPPESSVYNSREFRVQFYAKKIKWTQKKVNSSGTTISKESGTAAVATRYAMYSIDRKVS